MKSSSTIRPFTCALGCALHNHKFTGKTTSAVSVVLLSFVVFASGCIGLTGASKPGASQESSSASPAISVEPGSIRFGSVAVGGTASQSVTISNGGGADLTVSQASAAGAGVSVSGVSFPLVIAAGKQATFLVVFSPKTAGALSGSVSVASNASTTPSTVALSGTAMASVSLLTASASTVSFGAVAIGATGTRSVILTNAGNSDVTLSNVAISGSAYAATGVSGGLTLTPGQSATLDAAFSPAAAGNFTGVVTIASNATNSPVTISLSGTGTQSVAHTVALTWTPSASAVAGYNVYRSQTSGGPYSRLDASPVAAESYNDAGVQAGLTYYYVVTSVTASGVESADSAQVSATIPTP